MVLIIAGIAFKIGAAPFQIWVPDVYHGSPMPITAFLSVSSKAAGFFILLNLVNGPFSGAVNFLLPLLGFVATFTIFFGNLAACAQRNLKRMLGLSGVAHAGYLLVAIMASMVFPGDSDRAVWVLFFYMFVYLVASFSVFAVMSLADLPDDNEHEFSDYESLARKHPFAWVCHCMRNWFPRRNTSICRFYCQASTSEHCFRGWFVFVPCSNGRWCSHFDLLLFWLDQRNHFSPETGFRR